MKQLPRNVEAEASLLGCLTLDPDLIGEVSHLIDERCFTLPAHAVIYRELVELFDAGKDIDSIVLGDVLTRKKDFSEEDASDFITKIMDTVVSAANHQSYLNIVREKFVLRSLIEVNNQILENCYSDYGDVDELLDRSEHLIFDLASKRKVSDSYELGDLLKESLLRIESREGGGLLTGLPSGFADLDELTCGFQNSELIILAARPSMGKTTLALNIAEHVGLLHKKGVLIFSLEMAASQLTQNMLCSHARVNSHKLRRNYLANEEFTKLSLAAGALSEAKIYIDDQPGMNIRDIKAKARRMKVKHNIDMVIVDYLQLIESSGVAAREGRVQAVSDISRSLKSLARELKIPVVALAQLSRAVEQRDGNKPRMSDLRESGSIEQDADVVILLYREDYYDRNTENQGVVDLILSKQRNGPTGDVKLKFRKEFMRFENLSYRDESEMPPL
jgi:replicative DNA helicase